MPIRIIKLKLKMYLLLLGVYIGVMLFSGFGFYIFAPVYLKFLPAISVFYCVTGLVFNYALDRCRYQPNNLVTTFMIARMVKFLLTIAFLVISVKGFHLDEVPFAITLMCNYFLYTVLELYLFNRYSTWHNKRATSRNEKKN